MQYTLPILRIRFYSPALIQKNPRFRGEYVLLMHYTGSSPCRGTQRPRSRRALAGPHKRITPPTSARHCDTRGAILKQWGHVE